jgi:hypothetical protein
MATQISSIDFKHAQYVNAPIVVSAISSETDALWHWEVRGSTDNVLVDYHTGQNPTFVNVKTPGFYDLILWVKTATDYYPKIWRHAFRVFPARITEATADYVINVAASGVNFFDFTGINMSDKRIFIKGTNAGTIVQLHNLQASAGHPCYIEKADNDTAVEWTCNPTHPHALWFSSTGSTDGCRYIVVNGFNQDGTPGITIRGNTSTTQVVFADGKFTDIELSGIAVSHLVTADAAAIGFIPTVGASNNIDNWYCDNLVFYCIQVTNAGEEGFYVLYNNQNAQSGNVPPSGRGGIIAYCSVNRCGRDAYQFGGWLGFELHNCEGYDWGLQQEASHESAISHNAGSAGAVYENKFVGGKMFYNLQSGPYPYDKRAGETQARNTIVAGNVFANGTYPVGGQTEPFAFYCQNATPAATTSWNLYCIGNTFDTDKKFMESFWVSPGWVGTDWAIVNNIIIKNGNAGDYPEYNITGPAQAAVTGTVVNNLVRERGSDLSNLYFADYAGHDYTITSLSSVAYSGTPTDVGANYAEWDKYLRDVLGFPQYVYGIGYTFGAYSGYGRREVAPPDLVTPSVTVAITAVTANGGTLTWTTNKTTVLYWALLADGAPAPTAASLVNGTAGLQRGYLINPAGTTQTAPFTGLTPNTPYDVWVTAVSLSSGAQTAVAKTDFITAADTTAPTLSAFTIPDANRNRVNFSSSEAITATGFSGFSITGKTITGITINAGATTGHYFTLGSAFTHGDAATIAYTAVANQVEDVYGNDLGNIAATAITNSIVPGAYEPVVWINTSNATPTGNSIVSTTNSAYATSAQIIPANSNGNITFDFNVNTRDAGSGAVCGPIDKDVISNINRTNIIMSLSILAANDNVDWYIGNTYTGTISFNQGATRRYRIEINRADNKTRYYSGLVVNGAVNTWVLHATHPGTIIVDDFRASFRSTVSGKGVYNVMIQADKGLQ